MAALNSLHPLYVEELKDLYSAEKQILKALPRMTKAATHQELKRAFTTHERQTRTHVERLDRIFKDLGTSPRGKKCVGVEGIIKEGAELIKEKPAPEVLDAGLVAAAQHVEHYEMASYGTTRAWALKMGHQQQAALLQQTLDEERQTDELLTQIAERSINVDAEASTDADGRERTRAMTVHREPEGGGRERRSATKSGARSKGKAASHRTPEGRRRAHTSALDLTAPEAGASEEVE